MVKSSITLGLLALFCLRFCTFVQGTLLPPSRREIGQGGDINLVIHRLPLLSLVSSKIVNHQRVIAQGGNSTCNNTSGFEIQSQSDLDAFGSCTTVNGNILIQSISIDTVTIPNSVTKVIGNVQVGQISALTTFTASGLQSISGTFELLNLTGLQTLSAPSLTSVGGINFVILPLLQTMTLGITQAGDVRISDTELSTLSGFSLSTVNDFGIGIVLKFGINSR
jgi:hypothetical protein